MTHVDWHGDEAMEYVRKKAMGALARAAITVTRRAKQLLSLSGTASYSGIGGLRRNGKKLRKGARIYGANPSSPGEPPHKQTGRLRGAMNQEIGDVADHVGCEVDPANLKTRFGTNVKYGKYLELGTKRGIAPRPWLRRALNESLAK